MVRYQKYINWMPAPGRPISQRLRQAAQRVLREVPGVSLARDSAGRETDIAFDHAEFATLAPAQIDAIEAVLHAEGLHTTRSSIHTHGAVSPGDKWTGAVWAVRTLLGRDLASELDHWVAVGDSGNDEAMFRHFRHSVGVANIRLAAPRMQALPTYVTLGERGAGFAAVSHCGNFKLKQALFPGVEWSHSAARSFPSHSGGNFKLKQLYPSVEWSHSAPKSGAKCHCGLASPSFSTSAFSFTKVSCANFWYWALLMYMGTMS